MKGIKVKSKRKIRNKKKIKKIGEPPGTLVYVGEKAKVQTKIKVIDFNKETYLIKKDVELDEDLLYIEKNMVRWIYITGLTEVNIIENIGKLFNLHPLVLEDILNTSQRPKFEDYNDYIFIVLPRILWNEENKSFENEQISIIIGSNFVISFSELESDTFNPILERIITSRGRVRSMGPDYLAYTLMDIIVDNYFIILDIIGEIIDDLEENLVTNPEPEVLQSIYHLRRNSIDLRKTIWPLRELINKLQREQSNLISDDLQIYLRDVN
ncbi:MAG: CorA family divalent cation transporter, partial [Promethearchaeota archaeon]